MKSSLYVFIILAFVFVSCNHSAQSIDVPVKKSFTSLEKAVVSSDNSFGFKLFSQLNTVEKNKNVFISPFSVSMAFGMVLNGANGATLDSLKLVLEHAGYSIDEINNSYKNISSTLTNLDPGVNFQIANSIWYKQGFEIFPKFLQDNEDYFNAEVASLDFSSPDAVQTINAWVKAKTNGKIESILNGISPEEVMFLINAIYFKGTWTYQFKQEATTDESFTTASGNTVICKLMGQKTVFAYFADDDVQVIDLPYGERQFSMTVLLPKKEISIDDYAEALTQEQWDNFIEKLDSSEVNLFLPKFKLEYEKKLNDELKAMGMGIAFSDMADFSNISNEQLLISEVKHKTFVEVNEEGTEAAAVTSIGFSNTSIEPNPTPVMRIDHPFIFAIREHGSGTILFIGKIVEPKIE